MAVDWKRIIETEIEYREGREGANKIPDFQSLLKFVIAAEKSDDDDVIRLDGNKVVFNIPEMMTSIRINAPGGAFGG